MGFASIGAFIMLFFALIIVVSTFVLINGRLVDSTKLAYTVERERFENQAQTSIRISSISFDNLTSPDTTTIMINNTGKNKIDPAYLDVYIDHVRIPRDPANRTLAFSGANTINPLHWDPGETMVITVLLDLGDGTHRALVSTDYGVKDSLLYDYG